MERRAWSLLTLSLLALLLLLMALSVILVDPFEIYHQATAFIPPIDNGTQNYSNAGIAKSYAYDSVVIGSSMTENFRPSQLDGLFGGSFVKLPINGGPPFNHRQMMEMAFGTHDVRRVLYCVDIDLFTYFYTTPKCEMPTYLYDDNPLNDVYYWFNKSILTRYLPKCLRTLGQTNPALRDEMYTWGDLYPYGEDAVLRGRLLEGGRVEQEPLDGEFSQQTRLNVEHNILPFIEAHPDTEFVFFFPPYSIVRWYQLYRDGTLGYHLSQKEAVAAALLPYENVRVYDFTYATDWILDLDNYIDASHYGPWINDAMAERMTDPDGQADDLPRMREHDRSLIALCEALADGAPLAELPGLCE